MRNLKVKLKLMLSFFIVIVMAIIVGVVGVIGMSSINSADNRLYESNLVAISAMGEIRESLQRERIGLRNAVIDGGNAEKIQATWVTMDGLEKNIEENFVKYENSIEDKSEEEEYFKAKKIYQEDFKAIKQKIYEASLRSGQEASSLIFSEEVASITNEMVNAFTVSMQNNDRWAKESVDNNSALFVRMLIILGIVLGIAVAVAVFMIFYISGLISKPLITLTKFMEKAGTTGDITLSQEDIVNIGNFAKAKDEIGQCIASTAAFVNHLTVIAKELALVSGGELTAQIDCLSEKDIMGMALKEMVDSLNAIFTEIQTASNQVSSGASQVSQGAQQLASGSSEQSASIEEFSASLTELQDKTNHNAENSIKAKEVNSETGKRLDASIRSMGEMLGAMRAIDESSSSITKVIKVIDDIAFQTNILALNAAVEAARAGQHGKGFAVVADEVRNLASKSAAAAKETAALIEGSSERVKEGNQIVVKTNTDLEAAAENAQESTRLIEEVASASAEQAKSIHEINQGIEQISTVVQANSATAEESAAASEEMSAQAAVLNEIVSRFKLKQQAGSQIDGGFGSAENTSLQPNTSGFALSHSKY